jgi:nickel-dependent lactate racemase
MLFWVVGIDSKTRKKKIPKLVKSTRSSKEIGLSEDETKMTIYLEKTNELIEGIDYAIN